MRIIGFADVSLVLPDSVAGSSIEGYTIGIREDAMMVNSVDATVLTRPGTYPTFGIGVVGAMYLQGELGYGPPGVLEFEPALQAMWKRLNPVIATPRELRVQRNGDIGTNTFWKILAILQVPQFSSTGAVNFKDISFVAAQPFFVGATPNSGSGSF